MGAGGMEGWKRARAYAVPYMACFKDVSAWACRCVSAAGGFGGGQVGMLVSLVG